MEEDNEEVKRIKVILVGETGVGKTSIINRYVNDIFNEDTLSTITASCFEKEIVLNDKKKSRIFLEIWDTCGQERYRDLGNMFFRNAKVAIMIYDITSKSSFNDIKNYWYKKVKENSPEDISKYLNILYIFSFCCCWK